MFERIEEEIRQSISRRLKVSGGQCHMTVRNMAKGVLMPLGLYQSLRGRLKTYEIIDRILQETGGELWGHRGNGRNKVSDRIYAFNQKEVPV